MRWLGYVFLVSLICPLLAGCLVQRSWTPIQMGLHEELQIFDEETAVRGVRLNPWIGCNKSLTGVDFAIASNVTREHSWGLQLAGFGNYCDKQFIGIQFAGWENGCHGNSTGLQVATYRNIWEGRFRGLAFSLQNIAHDGLNGVQLGFADLAFPNMNGVQLGFLNSTSKANGLQFGAWNMGPESGNDVNGVQLGLINECRGTLRGVQFGLLNFYGKSNIPIPVVNIRNIFPSKSDNSEEPPQ